MAVEIPIYCQGNRVLTEIGIGDMPANAVSARVEMVGICGKLDKKGICLITGENCILKSRRTVFTSGLGDGDEEFID